MLRDKKGLTIIETLVATGIVSIVLGATILLIFNVSRYGTAAESRTLAVNYAQEAIDIVKNIRDNEYCNFFSDYEVGRNYRIVSINGGEDGFVLSNDFSGYSDAPWVDIFDTPEEEKADLATNMQRRVRLEEISKEDVDGKEDSRRIEVTVRWQEREVTGWQDYTMVTDIYKWKY